MINIEGFRKALADAGIEPSVTILDKIEGIVSVFEQDPFSWPMSLTKDVDGLADLIKHLDSVKADFRNLSNQSRQAFEAEYRSKELVGYKVQDDLDALSRLSEVSTNFLCKLKESMKPGRNRDERRHNLFYEFGKLYEQNSGNKFHHKDKRQGGKGSKFVVEAVRLAGLPLSPDQADYSLKTLSETLKRERDQKIMGDF